MTTEEQEQFLNDNIGYHEVQKDMPRVDNSGILEEKKETERRTTTGTSHELVQRHETQDPQVPDGSRRRAGERRPVAPP